MQMCSIASGSSGNCIYVGSETTHLLVDCGISGKRIENGLKECQVEPEALDGILITHEHIDHISGLGVMIRRYGKPIYATSGTIEAIKQAKNLGNLSQARFIPIQAGWEFTIGDINISSIPVWHDAAEPVAYRFDKDGQSIGILTDSGTFDQTIVDQMQGLSALLIEANHDIHMLQAGRYPYYLKQRILGERGHLSNENSGRFLSRILHDRLKAVVLGHLSKENNMPQLAYETVRVEITMADNEFKGSDFPIIVARRSGVSDIIHI